MRSSEGGAKESWGRTRPLRRVRVAVLGCGRFANSTRLPNLQRIEGVDVVAVCDRDRTAAETTAARFGVPKVYTDGMEMLARERFDALYSIVPAYARTADGVEVAAARQRIHLFCEKPQADDLGVALAIERAISEGKVIGTVGFRERYRPLFEEAKELLVGRHVIHVHVQSVRPFRPPDDVADADRWWAEQERRGGWAMEWGVHAVDYARFMTGQMVTSAQAFYYDMPSRGVQWSQAIHLQFASGATFDIVALQGSPAPWHEPLITVFHDQGYLALARESRTVWRLIVNGEVVRTEDMDPWLEQDRCFIEAVRLGDPRLLKNDFRDGLWSLAPILAARESARRGGACLDVPQPSDLPNLMSVRS